MQSRHIWRFLGTGTVTIYTLEPLCRTCERHLAGLIKAIYARPHEMAERLKTGLVALPCTTRSITQQM